jgi:membrane protease YdiL (CAAX protease family)
MRKINFFKIIEFFFIFILLPLFFFYKILPSVFVLPTLWIFSFYVIFLLRNENNKALFDKFDFKDFLSVIKRFIIFSIAIFLFTYIFYEDKLFNFFYQKPNIYILVMILYPLLSVIPQELIFRKFFLFRYEYIFTPKALILLNAAVFGFIHIIFSNYIALLFSFIGGLLFIKTYINSKSLSLVCIEHALYGDLIFTVGLGEFFYHGNI